MRFIFILFFALLPLYLIIVNVQPELAWYFGISVFSLFSIYLVYRIILETVLYKKQEEETEKNDLTFGTYNAKTFYDIHKFRKALKNRYKNK